MTLHYVDGFETYGPGLSAVTEARDVYGFGENAEFTFEASDRILNGQCLNNGTDAVGVSDSTSYRAFRIPLARYGSGSTWIIGFAWRCSGGVHAGAGTWYRVLDWRDVDASNLCSLRLVGGTTDLELVMETPPAATINVETATSALPEDTNWHYIEMKITFGNGTDGSYEVRVDGTAVMDSTVTYPGGTDTSFSGKLYPTEARMGHMIAKDTQLDDLYICDDQGAAPLNDFLNTSTEVGGNIRVARVRPDGVGASSDFTAVPGAGDNYDDVVEDAEDGDSSYVESGTAGHKDMYHYEDIDTLNVGTIYAVIAKPVLKRSDTGTRTCQYLALSNGTEEASERTIYPPSVGTYVRDTDLWLTDPDTGLAWTPQAFNAAQFGLEIVS